MATLWHHHSNDTKDPESRAPLRVMRTKYHEHCWGNDFPAHGRAHYQEHNNLVRKLGMGRNFLEYNVSTGWEPLLEFLGLPAVDHAKAFPRSDDWVAYKKTMGEQKAAQESSRISEVERAARV